MVSVRLEGDEAIIADFAAYPAKASQAMVRAMNRSIASGRTAMVRAITADTGLKSRDVRDAIVMREATLNRPEAKLAASLERLPLSKFDAHGPEPSRGQGRGVSYRLPTGRGRIDDAFIATMRSGHRGVFKRIGPSVRKSPRGWTKNLPIEELHGPSLGKVFAKFRQMGIDRTLATFEKNLDHELQFETSAAAAEMGVGSSAGELDG